MSWIIIKTIATIGGMIFLWFLVKLTAKYQEETFFLLIYGLIAVGISAAVIAPLVYLKTPVF